MTEKDNSPASSTLFHVIMILFIGVIIYSNSLNVPFTFDDKPNITNNPVVKDLNLLFDAIRLKSGSVPGDPKLIPVYASRALGYLSFALNYKFHGLSVYGYHLVNLAIHIGNALLVYSLAGFFFTGNKNNALLPGSDHHASGRVAACMVALLFVCHPVQTQAVTYIVQRFTSLTTLFYLLAIVLYIKSRAHENKTAKASLYIFSVIATVCAMKTKEIAFTLPLVLIMIEVMFLEVSRSDTYKRLLPFVVTLAIIPVTLLSAGNSHDAGATGTLEFAGSSDISRYNYFITQLTVIIRYVSLLVLPIRQNLDYDYPLYRSFADFNVAGSAVIIAVLIAVVFQLYRISRRDVWYAGHMRIICFGILWFFITLSVESSFIRIKDLMFEHRLYLPATGFFLSVAALVALLITFLSRGGNQYKKIVTPVFLAVIAALSIGTVMRNNVWSSEITLWEDVVSKSPNKARSRNNLALAYTDGLRYDRALAEYRISLGLKPDSGIHHNIGNIYLKKGNYDEALAEFRKAVALKPDFEKAYNGMCNVYYKLQRFPEALQACGTAIKLKPGYAEAYNMVGMIYYSQNNFAGALEQLRLAISHKPDFVIAHNNAGNAYAKINEYSAALKEYQIVSSLDSKYVGVHMDIGRMYHKLGRYADAVREFDMVLKHMPDFPGAGEMRNDSLKHMAGNR